MDNNFADHCILHIFFQWLESTFLHFFTCWESAVANREGFSDSEKKAMLLSAETLTGLRMTGTCLLLYITSQHT